MDRQERPSWGEFDIEETAVRRWKFGPMRLWARCVGTELWLATGYRDSPDGGSGNSDFPPEGVAWARWAIKGSNTKVQLDPKFPNRPVVVKPEATFQLTEHARARIFVRVPLWVGVSIVDKTNTMLTEVPTVVLSNTWFGSFTQGELCYWISSTANWKIEPDPLRNHLAICPIEITNLSNGTLTVEKICLRVENLSLFELNGQLWSDSTEVSYRGGDELSQVRPTGTPPEEARGAKAMARPRTLARKGFTAKTFATLRDLPGLGFIGS